MPQSGNMTTPIVKQPEKAGSNISLLDIIALVWMLGSLLFISVRLVSYFHYKHQILKMGKIIKDIDVLRLLMKLKHELHINCTVYVIEYPKAASPLLIGFCNHILFLSCDERVTQGTDYATRKAYTETLLSTLHKQSAKKTALSTEFYGEKQIMKKRFKNILAKKRKKNGAAVLICTIMLAVSLGTLVGCSITKENTEDGSSSLGTEDIQDENSQTDQPSPDSVLDNDEHDSNESESVNPETFPVGEYHDDMGSQLIISKVDDKNYSVDFGIYKSFYVEEAVGSYDANSGILSFSGIELGTDITGTEIKLSADVTIQGDNLLVTLTHSEYSYWPVGTSFEFEPGQP